VAFSGDGTEALTDSYGITTKLWNVDTASVIRTFTGMGVVRAFSPEAGTVLSTLPGNRTTLWNVATGASVRVLTGHAWEVRAAAFSRDGAMVLTGSVDKTAKLWNVATGTLVRTFTGHGSEVMALAFSPDGTRALSGSGYMDETAKIWDVATGVVLHTLAGHLGPVCAVAFSPDGSKALTGGGTAKLWDVGTGAELRTYAGHRHNVESVAFSPGGSMVLTGSSDNTARLWQVPGGSFDVTVPDVTGQTQAAAESSLAQAHLVDGAVTLQCSDTVAAGAVISQNPAAGRQVSSGSGVALVISAGLCRYVTFTVQPHDLARYVGQYAQFTVATTGGMGALRYQWWFEDEQKTQTPVGGNAPTLTLVRPALEDTGNYWCEATDTFPATYSSEMARLEVTVRVNMPLLGGAGAAMLAGIVEFGGAFTLRRRRS
jgi:hypothetical protein